MKYRIAHVGAFDFENFGDLFSHAICGGLL